MKINDFDESSRTIDEERLQRSLNPKDRERQVARLPVPDPGGLEPSADEIRMAELCPGPVNESPTIRYLEKHGEQV